MDSSSLDPETLTYVGVTTALVTQVDLKMSPEGGTDGVRSRRRHRVRLQEVVNDCGWESRLPSQMTEVCGKPHRSPWQQRQQQNPTQQMPERLRWRPFILFVNHTVFHDEALKV